MRISARAPRNWGGPFTAPPQRLLHDPRPRWVIAGGHLVAGRMIALKGDPIWGELGSADNFDDALNVDHPPFAYNSGMGWREISKSECARLNVTGPHGASVAEFHAGPDRPQVIAGELPVPTNSVRAMDPQMLSALEAATGTTAQGGQITLPTSGSAYDARRAERLRKAIEDRKAELRARAAP